MKIIFFNHNPMAEVIVIVVVSAVGIGVSLVGITMNSEDPYWYDFISRRNEFHATQIQNIDELLMRQNGRCSSVGNLFIESDVLQTPGIGAHYYYYKDARIREYFDHLDYITLYKMERKTGDKREVKYICYVSPFRKRVFRKFMTDLSELNPGMIPVFSIDISSIDPKIIQLFKICDPARQHQREVVDEIYRRFSLNRHKNIKVLIYGERGAGKTYIAKLLYQKIKEAERAEPLLFDDFDPSSIGVDIKPTILRKATSRTPVILAIDEIDIAYRKTVSNEPCFDPRIQHTRNKATFNNMLDAIENTKNIIGIYTTEINPSNLAKENDNFKSYMREGRVDIFVNLTSNDYHFFSHSNMFGANLVGI